MKVRFEDLTFRGKFLEVEVNTYNGNGVAVFRYGGVARFHLEIPGKKVSFHDAMLVVVALTGSKREYPNFLEHTRMTPETIKQLYRIAHKAVYFPDGVDVNKRGNIYYVREW